MLDPTVPTLVLDGVLVAAGLVSALVAWRVFRKPVSAGVTLAAVGLGGFILLVYGRSGVGRELAREWDRVLQANASLIVAQEELRLTNEELRERNRQLLEAYPR